VNRAGRAFAALALAGLLAAPAVAKPPRGGHPGLGTANPSALVAAELAFARMAAEKGQWAAFRKFAADDAVMFVPQTVRAHDWLKGRKDPAQALAWQPYQVWMSCDGTLGVTKGAWQRPDGAFGYFTTAWKRQKDGSYRWVMDQGDTLSAPLDKPDFLEARVADCSPHGQSTKLRSEDSGIVVAGTASNAPSLLSGRSDDGTLIWAVAVQRRGARVLEVRWAKAGVMAMALSSQVAEGD